MSADNPSEKRPSFWRSLSHSPLMDILQFLLLMGLISWLFARGSAEMGYNWQWYRIPRYIYTLDGEGGFTPGPLLEGLKVTLQISAVSLVFSFVIGLVTALFRLSDSYVARLLARFYLETSRNTPLLIQIFFIYFALGPVLGLGRFFSAVLALSLFEGAYASEIFRAGIVSIARGQWEAAHSLGLSGYQSYRYIILPQAVRRILPPLTSQAVSLIKDSALVSTISIYDLVMQTQALASETYLTFELWFTVALMYLSVTATLSLLVAYMERRFKVVG